MEFVTKGKDGYDAFLEGRILKDGELLSTLPSLMRNHLRMINAAHALHALKFANWRKESVELALTSGCAVTHMAGKFKSLVKDKDGKEEVQFPDDWQGVKVAPVKDGRICRIGDDPATE